METDSKVAAAYEKLEKGDMVAVLYSPGFGAGWYTWNMDNKGLVFDKDIVQAVLNGNLEKAAQIAEQKYPGTYVGGAEDLVVKWLPKGTKFEIREYDGNESLVVFNNNYDYLIA